MHGCCALNEVNEDQGNEMSRRTCWTGMELLTGEKYSILEKIFIYPSQTGSLGLLMHNYQGS